MSKAWKRIVIAAVFAAVSVCVRVIVCPILEGMQLLGKGLSMAMSEQAVPIGAINLQGTDKGFVVNVST